MWASIVGDLLVGPYLTPSSLKGHRYDAFLRETLPLLLEELPLDVRLGMWFQYDEAPDHNAVDIRLYLNETFWNKWIERNVAWPQGSPDLTPLNLHLWVHMKSLVQETPLESGMEVSALRLAGYRDVCQVGLPLGRRRPGANCNKNLLLPGWEAQFITVFSVTALVLPVTWAAAQLLLAGDVEFNLGSQVWICGVCSGRITRKHTKITPT